MIQFIGLSAIGGAFPNASNQVAGGAYLGLGLAGSLGFNWWENFATSIGPQVGYTKMNKYLLIIFLLTLLGCDTLSLYKISSHENNVHNIPVEGKKTEQELTVSKEDVRLHLYVNRFNFDFRLELVVFNDSKDTLEFEPGQVIINNSGRNKNLTIKNVRFLENFGNNSEVKNTLERLKIPSGSSLSLIYIFDGTPVLRGSHVLHGSEQEHLEVAIKGLSKRGHSIPISLSMDEQRIEK